MLYLESCECRLLKVLCVLNVCIVGRGVALLVPLRSNCHLLFLQMPIQLNSIHLTSVEHNTPIAQTSYPTKPLRTFSIHFKFIFNVDDAVELICTHA